MGEGRKDEGYRGGRDRWSKEVMEGKRERKKKREKEKKKEGKEERRKRAKYSTQHRNVTDV